MASYASPNDNDDLQFNLNVDAYYGRDGNDRFSDTTGINNLSFYGGNGNDTLFTSPGPTANLNIFGGNGNDWLYSTNDGSNHFYGDDGNDIIQALGVGADIIYGGGGFNAIYGGAGDDAIYGGDDDDQFVFFNLTAGAPYNGFFTSAEAGLFGEAGADTIYGGRGNDYLNGGSENDFLSGDEGNDRLDGGPGADLMVGGLGDDQYSVDNVSDSIVEGFGQGNDHLIASVSYVLSNGAQVETMSTIGTGDQTLPINLTGNDLNNTIFGNQGDNILDGQGGADDLFGQNGNDTYFVDNINDRVFEPEGGDDRVFTSVSFNLGQGQHIERLQTTDNNGTQAINLRGNEFDNFIAGNNGNNVILGGAGIDTLLGLGGSDRFVFDSALNASNNVDLIGDFTVGQDIISLAHEIFTGLGTQQFLSDANFLVVGSRGQDGDDRVLYDPSNGALHFDADGNGAGAAVTFAFVSPGTNLHASDIFVI